jgi:hypothetical protein
VLAVDVHAGERSVTRHLATLQHSSKQHCVIGSCSQHDWGRRAQLSVVQTIYKSVLVLIFPLCVVRAHIHQWKARGSSPSVPSYIAGLMYFCAYGC